MVTDASARARSGPGRFTGAGALLTQAVLLVLTLVVSVVLVVMLTMARRDRFLADERAWSNNPASGPTYISLVTDYLLGLKDGHLSGADTTPVKRRVMNKQIVDSGRRSLELLLVSTLVAVPLGLLWGVLMAQTNDGTMSMLLFGTNTLALALPSFLVLLVLITLVADITQRTGVRLAYTQGYGLDRHLIIPVAVLALRGGAYLAQVVSVAQREISEHDWIRVARAKGLHGFRLWRQHILPLMYLPILGGVLGMLRVLVGALLLVEYLYNWKGISRLLLQIDESGLVTFKPEPVEVGAAVLLVVFFVVTDALGRTVIWGASMQRHETGAA